MAEVKTYKCDVCGEVFHADGEYGHRIAIISEGLSKDEENLKRYNHLCPKCTGTIVNVIEDPDVIRDLEKEVHTKVKYIDGYVSLLGSIYNKLKDYPLMRYYSDNPSQYADNVKWCLDEIDNRECELLKWKRITDGVIGFAVGIWIVLLIKAVC